AAEAAQRGDNRAVEAFQKAIDHFARVLGPAIHLLNPELVIIGGDVGMHAYTHVRERLSRAVRHATMPPAFGDMQIVRAEVRNASPALQGGLALLLRGEGPEPEVNPLLSFLQRRREVGKPAE